VSNVLTKVKDTKKCIYKNRRLLAYGIIESDMLDIGLITVISGMIISIIALVVSILGFLYHRRRTNIMEEQINIIKEEAQKRKLMKNSLRKFVRVLVK